MKPTPPSFLSGQFVRRLRELIPAEQFDEVMGAFATPRPTTLRTNRLKTTAGKLRLELEAAGAALQPVPWYTDAFVLKDQPKSMLFPTGPNQRGELYVQSLSSMIPPLALQPQPGETVLDLTAAPGSKTTQMAAIMGNTGKIVANDWNRVRLYKLEANLKIQGVVNVTMVRLPGEELWRRYPERFDRTLADVPCSMEGRIYSGNPKTYARWSMKSIKQLAKRQQWLLRSAVSATKPGGVVVYSTCTLAPEENEGVVDWLLKKEAGKIEIEEISIPGLQISPGLTGWEHKSFDPQLARAIRIWPSRLMEGFFVAKLRKISSTIT